MGDHGDVEAAERHLRGRLGNRGAPEEGGETRDARPRQRCRAGSRAPRCAATASPARSRPVTAARRGAAFPAGCTAAPRGAASAARRRRRRGRRRRRRRAGRASRSQRHRARGHVRPGHRDRSPRWSRRWGPGSATLWSASSGDGGAARTHADQARHLTVPAEQRLGRRRARRHSAPRERARPEVACGGAHRSGPELARRRSGRFRRARRTAHGDDDDDDARRASRRPPRSRGGRDFDVEVAATEETEQREVDAFPARRPSPTRRSARTSAPRRSGLVELTGEAGAGAVLRRRRHQGQRARRAVPLFVDRRGTGERGRVGAGRERPPGRERSPEVDADAAEREEHQAEPQQPERDRAPLRRAPVRRPSPRAPVEVDRLVMPGGPAPLAHRCPTQEDAPPACGR